MTFLLFLIFSIILFVVVLFLSVIRGVSSFIFGRPSSAGYSSQQRQNSSYSGGASSYSDYHASDSGKKVFSKDEGEYVNYEEIKE